MAVEAHVVLEPGADVAAELERPAVERDLIPADPGAGPGRVRGQPPERRDVELEHFAVDRHGVLDAHDELDVQRALDLPVPLHLGGLEDVAEVEALHLGFHTVADHLGREPIHQIGRVLVDAGGEVVRAHGERGHVRLEGKHAAPHGPPPSAHRWRTARSGRGSVAPAPP